MLPQITFSKLDVSESLPWLPSFRFLFCSIRLHHPASHLDTEPLTHFSPTYLSSTGSWSRSSPQPCLELFAKEFPIIFQGSLQITERVLSTLEAVWTSFSILSSTSSSSQHSITTQNTNHDSPTKLQAPQRQDVDIFS